MSYKFISLLILCISSRVFALPSLASYLANDLELQSLGYEVKKSELSQKSAKIDKGIQVSLSTGSATFQFGDNGNTVKFAPSASLSIPQANNLKFNFKSESKLSDNEHSTQNISFSLSSDIISGDALKRKIALLKAEHNVLTARRKFLNRAITAEKEYYTQLKNLFEAASSIIEAQKDLYEDTITFEEVKAKGYSTSSSKYRTSEMEVISDKHTVETKIRELEHECAVFASKCGETYTEENAMSFLPSSINEVSPLNIRDFSKDDYSTYNDAVWTHEYNTLERKSDKSFSLSGAFGYTMKNSSTKDTSDTVDTSLTTSINGLDLTTGVSFPVDSSYSDPVYTLSASINPSTFQKRSITLKTYEYSFQQELLDIQKYSDAYDTSIVEQENNLKDLQWSKGVNLDTYKLYDQLEQDTSIWYKDGIIKESEYKTAYVNKELYRIKLLINAIDMIIYNNTVKLLFYRDNEIQVNGDK